MKRALIAVGSVTLTFALIYGAFVFVTLEPDPREWEAMGRMFFVVFGFLCSVGVILEATFER